MIGVVHSNLYDLLGRWSWVVFGLGLAISIANLLASKGRFDWDLDHRLWTMRLSAYVFFLLTFGMAAGAIPGGYSGSDPYNDVDKWMYDKILAAGIALTFTLAFAIEAEYLRYKIKRVERKLKAQLAAPSNAHPTH
jgi:hypothetical protein